MRENHRAVMDLSNEDQFVHQLNRVILLLAGVYLNEHGLTLKWMQKLLT